MLMKVLRYWHRPRRHAEPLAAVAPGLATHSFTDRAGNQVGLASDGRSWTAVLRVDPTTTADLTTLLGQLAGTLAQTDGIRLAATQLVRWAVPRPADPQRGGARSTWDVYWVAVRFDPAADPQAVSIRGGGQVGAMRATAVAALRLSFHLRRQGLTVRPVQERELAGELACSLGNGGGTARETWWSWSVGTLHHAALRVAHPDPAQVLAWQAHPPALSTSAAILLAAMDRGPRMTATLRVAVPADRDRRAVRSALRQATRGLGRGVRRMNGHHSAGVRATLPLGQ